ncbi:MAG: chromosomal replication initiator protein DnaA [Candidatus Woesebacteria bacterium]|jgi:chromosomal replication initiator protein
MIDQALPPEEVKNIWQLVCEDLKSQLTPAAFNTWILTNPLTEIKNTDQNRASGVISTPTAFHAANLKKNLYTQLKNSIERILKKTIDLEFQVRDPQQIDSATKKQSNFKQKQGFRKINPNQASQNLQSSTNQHKPNLNPKLNFASITNASSNISPRVEDLFSKQTIQQTLQDRAINAARRIGLRPNHTFKNFAVSTTNEMAHAAAVAVSKKPGTAYNPLFLYGGVGVGKTHLMHAIGHNILKSNPETRIIYCTGEEFTNEIISAIQTKKALRFKQKFRNIQILLLDDVQFIAGKNAVQEEFFHTFNALISLQSQIILTSDRPPHEINLMEDRLRSRFQAGLMIDIQQPSLELRAAIVLIKAQANNLNLAIDLAQQIAEKVDSARKIEGVITSVRSAIELKQQPLSSELIDSILAKEESKNKPRIRIRPDTVIKEVAKFYNFKQISIKGKRRNKDLVKARHVAMFLLKTELHISFVEIGKWFSNRDHTSVMHAFRKITALIDQDSFLKQDISELRRKLIKNSF